ncbi:hypothetical protein KY342_02825 [Candidatus Woesearchaeota archaeon]|nr:hypothetical protein [Candidatus Woesearchaeota archaeon]
MKKQEIGKVTHFFNKISVAIVELSGSLKNGDKISIEGHGKVVEQIVDSMQVDHKPVEEAKKGDAVGMKTAEPVKENDKVFKVTE